MQRYASIPHPRIVPLRREEVSRQVVIKASEGHRSFGKLLKRVYCSDEHLVVERDGFPVAVLMSYQEYEKLRRQQALVAFEQFSRSLGAELERQGVSEEEALAELDEDKKALYREKYGKRAS
jgi:prevent-host-death family protein